MRYVLALGLLIALSASASAAKVRHSTPRQTIVSPSPGLTPELTPQERKRLHDINIPSYNDPSKFGSG